VLYGTRSDPERVALYEMRQTYDHFFACLAPDEEVRKSKYYHEKSGNDKGKVFREERILYAANKHIKDSEKAKTLIASADHMLEVYNSLNRAHNRGELNKVKAFRSLEEMRTILEDWIDAIEYT